MSETLKRPQVWSKLQDVAGLVEPFSPEVESDSLQPVIVVNDSAKAVEVTGSLNATTILASPSSTQTIVQKHFNGLANTFGVGQLLYTVTSGKTFYLTEFYVNTQAGANTNLLIRDSTTLAGTVILGGLFSSATAGAVPLQFNFPTPMKFVNGLFLDTGATITMWIQIVGFEQ